MYCIRKMHAMHKMDTYVLTSELMRFAALPGLSLLTQFPARVVIILNFALVIFVVLFTVLFLRYELLNNVFVSYF